MISCSKTQLNSFQYQDRLKKNFLVMLHPTRTCSAVLAKGTAPDSPAGLWLPGPYSTSVSQAVWDSSLTQQTVFPQLLWGKDSINFMRITHFNCLKQLKSPGRQ